MDYRYDVDSLKAHASAIACSMEEWVIDEWFDGWMEG